MECDDSFFKVVHTKVKSVVPLVSETFKTGNLCVSVNVDTLKVMQNDSDTIETTNSVKTSKLTDQERHCKLHSCCNSCTYCVFLGHPQKKGASPAVEKIKTKPVKHASFVNHSYFVPLVENAHSVVQNLPVGSHLRDFWKIWAFQGASPKVCPY